MCPTALGARDRLPARQPEPCAGAVASAAAAAEPLERVPDESRIKACPRVRHVQLCPAVGSVNGQLHLARPVAQRVVDEVAERLLEAKPVALDACIGLGS